MEWGKVGRRWTWGEGAEGGGVGGGRGGSQEGRWMVAGGGGGCGVSPSLESDRGPYVTGSS